MIQTSGNNTLSELTLEQVRDSMLAYLREGNAGHYNIGRLYNHTVNNKLAEKNGHESAQAYFSQHIQDLSQATLSRYGAVAREFTEEACRNYGVMKLTTLRTYAQVADIQFQAGDPGSTPIDVPGEGGAVAQKPFSECSLEELKQAVKHKRQPSRASMPAADTARIEFMRECFSRHFAQGARVQLKTSVQGGKTLLTIQGVPLNDVERLMEALLDSFQPQLVRSAG
ncbi:hypothetical protein [Vitiosangium sp. GDMCC 1.1324]|uniref:hypothetical protein n=1 Tax=Vitiosangium sp. (strain GDMCC 1.1324) TaxID=2138576 RepID=UPI000D3BF8DC|nr:hypothetical protein [Vitiosangium sp. GDMCC 1.1324]PTL81929.1 hypothetical protein DAT35_19105 [Vitiosangium sp. GDMCC 1.1324]